MKIEINKEEYQDLLQSLFVMESIAGFLKDTTDTPVDNFYERISKLSDRFRSYAPEFGLEGLFKTDEKTGKHILSEENWDQYRTVIDAYDSAIFWSELESALARRDMLIFHPEEEIEQMSDQERADKYFDYLEDWRAEFQENGISRLGIHTAE